MFRVPVSGSSSSSPRLPFSVEQKAAIEALKTFFDGKFIEYIAARRTSESASYEKLLFRDLDPCYIDIIGQEKHDLSILMDKIQGQEPLSASECKRLKYWNDRFVPEEKWRAPVFAAVLPEDATAADMLKKRHPLNPRDQRYMINLLEKVVLRSRLPSQDWDDTLDPRQRSFYIEKISAVASLDNEAKWIEQAVEVAYEEQNAEQIAKIEAVKERLKLDCVRNPFIDQFDLMIAEAKKIATTLNGGWFGKAQKADNLRAVIVAAERDRDEFVDEFIRDNPGEITTDKVQLEKFQKAFYGHDWLETEPESELSTKQIKPTSFREALQYRRWSKDKKEVVKDTNNVASANTFNTFCARLPKSADLLRLAGWAQSPASPTLTVVPEHK